MSCRISLGTGTLVLVALCGSLVAGCGEQDPPAVPPASTPNVILISIDTLRPDHLGCYGYEAPTSPRLDLLCEDSMVFRQAVAHAPSTLHSHASMFTSLLPHHHQATWRGKTRLPDKALTLAEVLLREGYATAAFTGGGQMDRVFGLDQGFETYELSGKERFVGTVRRGIQWLDARPADPFFLFLHSYEVHHPYTPAPEYLALMDQGYEGGLPDEISIDLLRQINGNDQPLDPADLDHLIATYDAEIRSVDDGLGLLVDALRERDLYDHTLIVFTSDHGEEFGEHGVVGWHSHSLYDELLLVPLIVKLPHSEHAGAVVEAQVRSLDIPPTVVAALGVEVPAEFDGVDLIGVLMNPDQRPLVAISRLDRQPGIDVDSVRTGDWKLRERRLFDLRADPEELWNVSDAEIIADLESLRQSAVDAREPLPTEEVVPSDRSLEELRALGYID